MTKLARFHCSMRAVLCLQWLQVSWRVFHRDGEGKHLTHANNHISNNTLRTLSQSWSPTSSFVVGGANRLSLIAKRNRSNDSHVSFSSFWDTCTVCWIVLKTRWQSTACRLIKSGPEVAKRLTLIQWSNTSLIYRYCLGTKMLDLAKITKKTTSKKYSFTLE